MGVAVRASQAPVAAANQALLAVAVRTSQVQAVVANQAPVSVRASQAPLAKANQAPTAITSQALVAVVVLIASQAPVAVVPMASQAPLAVKAIAIQVIKVPNQAQLSHMDLQPRAKATTRTNIRASISLSTKNKHIPSIMLEEIGGTMEGCLIQRLYTRIHTILQPIPTVTERATSYA